MSNNRTTVYLRGELMWAKVLPKQLHKNNFDDYKQWTFDVYPEDVTELEANKIADKIKKSEDGKQYLQLRQKEFSGLTDEDGKPLKNKPIRIVSPDGTTPWDTDTELGNGTIADVRISIVDYGKGKKKGVYPVAIRVIKHVPYKSNEFKPLSDDDKTKYSVSDEQFRKDFGLEDIEEDAV